MGLYLCRSIVLHTCKCIKLQQLRSFDLAWCVLDLQCVVKHLASVPLWLAPAEPTHFTGTGRLFTGGRLGTRARMNVCAWKMCVAAGTAGTFSPFGSPH